MKQIHYESIIGVSAVFFSVAAFSFIFGSIKEIKDGGCTYKSIAARVNIPYVAGCQLFKERFDK